jgi:sarcosine oxidase subunit beta
MCTEITGRKGRTVGVTLAGGENIDAPVIINAAGPHSFMVNQLAGVYDSMKIKTRALRREVAHVPLPNSHGFEKFSYVTQDADVGCYTRPEVGGNVLIGSLDPECDAPDWVDPDDFSKAFTDQWKVQVYRQAQRLPNLPIPNKWQGVVDLYDVSDDWIPIYDKSDLPGFYMAVGTSGNQFKNAPVVGRLMADLVTKCEAGHDHDNDPVEYYMPHTGRTLNLGFFSRLREVNPDSSFTVVG